MIKQVRERGGGKYKARYEQADLEIDPERLRTLLVVNIIAFKKQIPLKYGIHGIVCPILEITGSYAGIM